MIRRSWWLGACAALLPGLAQATALMLVDGVTGSAKLQGYAGWFEIRAYSWSIDRSKTAQPLQFNVEYEWTAPASTLAQLAVTGTILKKIVIDQVAPIDGGVLLVSRVTCDEASFRTIATSTSASDRSVSDLQVQCGRLQWEYFDYATNKGLTATGKGSWNFKTNTP